MVSFPRGRLDTADTNRSSVPNPPVAATGSTGRTRSRAGRCPSEPQPLPVQRRPRGADNPSSSWPSSVGRLGDLQDLLVRQTADWDCDSSSSKEDLGLVDVADPRHDQLVHDGFADRRRIVRSKAVEHSASSICAASKSGPNRINACAAAADRPKATARPWARNQCRRHRHSSTSGPVAGPYGRLNGLVQMPGSLHSQVGMDRTLVIQVHEQMFAACFDSSDRSTDQGNGGKVRIAARAASMVSLSKAAAAVRRTKNRVTFGHARSLFSRIWSGKRYECTSTCKSTWGPPFSPDFLPYSYTYSYTQISSTSVFAPIYPNPPRLQIPIG